MTKGQIVTFFHPVTSILVKGELMRQSNWDRWWVRTDDGYGWNLGASEFFWLQILKAMRL
jgi:hypothetical protein